MISLYLVLINNKKTEDTEIEEGEIPNTEKYVDISFSQTAIEI